MTNGKILLSFDVEEFDIPLEYNHEINFDDQLKITTQGLNNLIGLLDKHDIAATFFTTAVYAQHDPSIVRSIRKNNEIASHGYSHSTFTISDLKKSKIILESITEKPVRGFRMPRLAEVPEIEIINAGYDYNSSLNPTWIPGRYNNLKKPRLPYLNQSLLNIPVSVTPYLRIPLFWLSCKIFPLRLLYYLMQQNLQKDKFLSLYFHPWEFTDISGFGLPRYISGTCSNKMLDRLDQILVYLKNGNSFITMSEFSDFYIHRNL